MVWSVPHYAVAALSFSRPSRLLSISATGIVSTLSILCGHRVARHGSVDGVRACADLYPMADLHPISEDGQEIRLRCGREMMPIVYEYSSFGMQEAAARGRLRFGRCIVGAHDPSWWKKAKMWLQRRPDDTRSATGRQLA